MPVALDVREAPYERAEALFSETAELVAAMTHLAKKSQHELNPSWTVKALSLLSPECRSFVETIGPLNWPTLSFLDFIPSTGAYHDVEELLNAVAALDIQEFLLILMNHEISLADIERLIRKQTTIQEFYDRLIWISAGDPAVLEALFNNPKAFRDSYLQLARETNTDHFRSFLRTLAPRYDASRRLVEERLRSRHPMAVMEEIKGRPISHHGAKVFLYSPSYFMYSHSLLSYSQDVFFLVYTLSGDQSSRSRVAAELADTLKVLADPSRLEILRRIRNAPSYGKELAAALGLTTATVSRHLEQLRSAGLVREERVDNLKYFSYDKEGIDHLLESLREYLDVLKIISQH